MDPDVMACIHRGAAEIGGSCIELVSAGKRLVLDLGRPLWAEAEEEVQIPRIPGLREGEDPSLVGVVISHGHPDHVGLVDQISPKVPLYMGERAARILNEAAFFTPAASGARPRRARRPGFLVDQKPLDLGPFRVIPSWSTTAHSMPSRTTSILSCFIAAATGTSSPRASRGRERER